MGVKVYTDVEKAVEGADVVMGLRISLKGRRRGLFPSIRGYNKYFGIDERQLSLAKPPWHYIECIRALNRGVELSPQVAYGDQSVINQQVTMVFVFI